MALTIEGFAARTSRLAEGSHAASDTSSAFRCNGAQMWPKGSKIEATRRQVASVWISSRTRLDDPVEKRFDLPFDAGDFAGIGERVAFGVVHEGGDEDDHSVPYEGGEYLYQTRFGAFFLFSYREAFAEDDYAKIEPLTPEQAREWLEKNQSWNVELIESLFGQMPEAGSGEVKFTLRLPESLRDRLAACAKAKEQSLNAWIVRCLESCAATAPNVAESEREIPPMGNLVGSNRTGWRVKGT